MSLKIVIPDAHTLNPGDLHWTVIQRFGETHIYPNTPAAALVQRCKGAQIVLPNKVLMTKEVLEQLPDLQYIGVTATGYNNVDLEYAKQRGLVVTNIQGYGTYSVAQHTFALILAITNRVKEHHQAVLEGQWARSNDFCFWNYPMIELAHKKIGIIGFGRIGKYVAKIAKAFGMQVLVHHRYPVDEATFEVQVVSLEQLFTESDIVSLHLPLNDENAAFVNAALLNKMKKTAYLVNTSRGGLIQEDDLFNALMNGTIAGAALDVLSEEPPSHGNVLLGAPNCIVTPHNAWATRESRTRMMDILAQNIQSFLNGNPINRIV